MRHKLRRHILRKGYASGNAFTRKEKFRAQISRKLITLKTMKDPVRCVYWPSREYGNEKSISLTRGQKKKKEKLQSFVHTYLLPILNPIVMFYAISI